MKQAIPNGLLSVDGSEIAVFINEVCYKFNMELAVDVKSFCHSAFSVSDSETAAEVLRVLDAHKALWGTPLALVSDHGSGNMSADVRDWLQKHHIEMLPAGPYNAKGNGTVESAFSQMKEVIGPIILDASSPESLAKSVFTKIASVYITMRNRLPRLGDRHSPEEIMGSPVSNEDRQESKAHYRQRAQKKDDSERQKKIDRIGWIIDYHHLDVDEHSLKNARKSIVYYDIDAIAKSEEAFLTAIRRDQCRCVLPYFFGILKNVQADIVSTEQ
jgi:Integrase core domain.